MSNKKQFNCTECGADFKVRHDMDESYYKILFCPFCSTELEHEDDYGEDSDDYEEV